MKYYTVPLMALVFVLLLQQCNSEVQQQSEVSYVGIDRCAPCHQEIYKTFVVTGMGKSLREAKLEYSNANFQNAYFKLANQLQYAVMASDAGLFFSEFLLNEKGDTQHLRLQKADYIVGSGHHTHSHLYQQGSYIYQLPMTWYAQKKLWDLPPGFEQNHSHFNRMIDLECMSCHNAMPVMAQGSDRQFVSIGNGIDCERCHGPGSAHIDAVKNGSKDLKIVQPSKLSYERQTDICQRCHLQGNNVLKPGKSFADFQPGMKLSDVFEIYLPLYEGGDQPFDMANHSARLQSSKCFQVSKGKLTCITCHNPHVSVKVTGNEVFNKSCMKCHQPENCTETKANRQKLQDNCVQCHMPAQGTEDIPHVSVHDHKIAIPAGTSMAKGKLMGLYAVNNKNPSDIMWARAYLSYFEKFESDPLYHQKALDYVQKVNDPELWIHFYYQEQDYTAIIKASLRLKENAEAMTKYRVGKAYERSSKLEYAALWYRKALETNADRPEFYAALIAVLIQVKELEEAEKWTLMALKSFPTNPDLLNARGYIELSRGAFANAKKYLNLALRENPEQIAILENLALLYMQTGDKAKAIQYLQKILSIDPKREKVIRTLKELKS